MFFRQNVACNLEPSPDGWGFRAVLGVEPDHPAARRHFVARYRGPALEHVLLSFDSTALDGKWWFAFDCVHAREDLAFEELAAAADDLNAMEYDQTGS